MAGFFKKIFSFGKKEVVEERIDETAPLPPIKWDQLDALKPDQRVMLKLTIPDKDDFYADLIKHKNVLRVVALSGGYSRDEANKRLARQHGMTASFSRALAEGLTAQQSDSQFNDALDKSIESIYQASIT